MRFKGGFKGLEQVADLDQGHAVADGLLVREQGINDDIGAFLDGIGEIFRHFVVHQLVFFLVLHVPVVINQHEKPLLAVKFHPLDDMRQGLVGWEHHGDPADIPGLEVIAEGKTINAGGDESQYAATIYPGTKKNWVLNAATIYWAMGLSDPPGHILPCSHHGRPHGPDERVQRITANFLKQCGVEV